MASSSPNGPIWRRTLVMLISLPCVGLAVAFFLKANMGMDPFTTFQLALAQLTNMTLGTWTIICNCVVVIAFIFIDRHLIGIGSLAFAVGIGPFIDLFTPIVNRILPEEVTLPLAIVYILIGTILVGIAISNYLPLNLGAQAQDMIAITIGRIAHRSVGFGLNVFNAIVFVIAFILGGPWGLGTLSCVFLVGILVNFFSKYLGPISMRMAGMQAPASKS